MISPEARVPERVDPPALHASAWFLEEPHHPSAHATEAGEHIVPPVSRLQRLSPEASLPFRTQTFDQLTPLAAALLPLGKWNKKRVIELTLLSSLLASCVSPEVTPTETRMIATSTAVMPATETPVPTPTESGPKEGDKIVENGYTYTYTLIPESGYKGWFRPVAKMPLDPWLAKYVPDGNGGYVESSAKNDIGPTTLLVEKGVLGEQAIEALTQKKLERGVAFPLYVRQLETWMRKHYFETAPNPDDYKYNTALQRGDVTYAFRVGDKEYTWTISPKSGATIYIIKNDPAVLTEENGFWTWVDGPYGTHFSTAFWGVDKNGIVGAISPDTSLDQLDPFELRILPLFHQVAVLKHDDVQGVGFDGPLQMLVTFAGEENPPIIGVKNRPVAPTPTP